MITIIETPVFTSQILMLLAYAKSEQENLTAAQKRALKALVEEELNDG